MQFQLRPWNPDDLESVWESANNSQIAQFMSDGFPDSKEKWEAFIHFATTNEDILYLAIEVDGKVIGSIGVSLQKDIKRKNAELGYWLAEPYWNKGIITKAIREIVTKAFQKFDIIRVFAAPFGTNTASHHVLEKVGFKLEARFEKTVYKNGEFLDELIYAIRREDWKMT